MATVGGREARKTVTVLFSDMVGSTELGDRLDPESIRRVVSRYFSEMQHILERHGGTVEKFIGDAIMAVLGIPTVHEDDALRTLRAAIEMRERLRTLNEELDRDWGVRLSIRTGINTGPVVAGDPAVGQAFVSGDTVNVAARLEQAAAPDEILLGEQTWAVSSDAIDAEPLAGLTLKGKPEPLTAWRLIGVSSATAALRRREASPFVGRADETQQLRDAFERAVREKTCILATVVGPAGIGKSRLVHEFTVAAGKGAQIAAGRCLPYGEGITYWPLADVLTTIAGGDLPATASRVVSEYAPVVAERIAAAVGHAGAAGTPAETFWAFRKLFEGLARERPLILVIDDIHWAEPTLLDLLEYIIDFASDAPILLLCLSRADLFEARPSWAVPRPKAFIVPLQPISADDASTLIERLGTRDLSSHERVRVARAAEGNPLFIEQLLALNAHAKDGEDAIIVPPTIQALLAARIDSLDESDRTLIERAAIEGRTFHRGAVVELLDERSQGTVSTCLISLARKEFIEPDQPLFADDDAFRFGHMLIRDAAYEAVPKQLRAELHERFAVWLERTAGDRAGDFAEILAYHLEHASRYHTDLGRLQEGRRLAESAGDRLTRCGLRASGRGDIPAAINLLTRAARILPLDHPRRLEVIPELGTVLTEAGDMVTAGTILDEGDERARSAGDEIAIWRVTIARLGLRIWTGSVAVDEMVALAEAAAAACGQLGDELGLARSFHLLGLFRMWRGASADADAAYQQALLHARSADARREESVTLQWTLINAWFGPTPASEGLRRCRDVLQQPSARLVEATAMIEQGCFLAMGGRFEEARAAHARGCALLEDLGQQLSVAGASQEFFDIEMLAGNPAAAERRLRAACEALEGMGGKGYLATRLGCLAESIHAQGRFDEAQQMSERTEAAAALDPSDIDPQIRWRAVRAKVLAQAGAHADAGTLIRDAVALIAHTDWLNQRASVQVDLAAVHELAGRTDEALTALGEAVDLYTAKENAVAVARTRAHLTRLREAR